MVDARIRQTAFRLPRPDGERMCISRGPVLGAPRGAVVHIPAFGEEMNKARHMTAWTARELAARRFDVLQIDLAGCGDSDGDFGDATWDDWVGDVLAACAMARESADVPLWLWGLRAGALLACDALAALPRDTSLMLWQPVLAGRQHLTQFLRLAATGAGEGGGATGIQGLRDTLAAGHEIEVAGYTLSCALADGMAQAQFALPDDFRGHVAWLEIAPGGAASVAPASQDCIARLRARGTSVEAQTVSGPSFWQTVEIEDCPALVLASVEALERRDASELRRATAVL